MPTNFPIQKTAIVIGSGPAGLMAAERLAAAGVGVRVMDGMPSVGRKFLLAGIGGLNLTHAEPTPAFSARYAEREPMIAPLLAQFGAEALRAWAAELGTRTFVGSSGRVFPTDMKAAPLLRAWLARLRASGVAFHMRHRWLGWREEKLLFATPAGEQLFAADAVVLALGGASWARLGSDGAWVPWLRERGVEVAPLEASNCGFDVAWSAHFTQRFAGEPLKNVAASFVSDQDAPRARAGECVVSQHGIEGSLVYAFSAPLRRAIAAQGKATLRLDLAPAKATERVRQEIQHPRGSRSMASHLQSRAGITGVKAAMLREVLGADGYTDAEKVAAAIKALPIECTAPRPIDEAISSAGGVRFEAMNASLMLQALPGVFCAGEMLDWEAPTGGYLLTACFASGRRAGDGAAAWLLGHADAS